MDKKHKHNNKIVGVERVMWCPTAVAVHRKKTHCQGTCLCVGGQIKALLIKSEPLIHPRIYLEIMRGYVAGEISLRGDFQRGPLAGLPHRVCMAPGVKPTQDT